MRIHIHWEQRKSGTLLLCFARCSGYGIKPLSSAESDDVADQAGGGIIGRSICFLRRRAPGGFGEPKEFSAAVARGLRQSAALFLAKSTDFSGHGSRRRLGKKRSMMLAFFTKLTAARASAVHE
jgi:hypothetical protein